ncbi:MAG: DegT/DnrJ/EryC1/StrS family aminotransferase [Verrucomicrobiota bacterium JB022]|nr:DegT/DnrJ/EryC1/StrS family aminotransferase [Verrucomicrobiota bacterium JB022]
MSTSEPVYVTKPFLPPREAFERYLPGIWERQYLTNQGPLAAEFEKGLAEYLQVPHLRWVANGTLALQLALRALGVKGEVITTPFTHIATTSAIVAEGCTPRYAEVDPETYNLDPAAVEAAITPQTQAILATHVFGNPCDIEALSEIARRHSLKLIFDAAHCFGVQWQGESVLNFGDAAVLSLHATKLFHSTEGGAVVVRDAETAHQLDLHRNFGIHQGDQTDVIGFNAKNSELHAAMGLANLPFADEILQRRRELCERYRALLAGVEGVQYQRLMEAEGYNHAYFPVVLPSEAAVEEVMSRLGRRFIYPRRYFSPSLSEQYPQYCAHACPISESLAHRIICLPLYHTLEDAIQVTITEELAQALGARTGDAVA